MTSVVVVGKREETSHPVRSIDFAFGSPLITGLYDPQPLVSKNHYRPNQKNAGYKHLFQEIGRESTISRLADP